MTHLEPYISAWKYWFCDVFGAESSQLRWPKTLAESLAQFSLIFSCFQINLSFSLGGPISARSLLHVGLTGDHQSCPFGPSHHCPSIPAFTTFQDLGRQLRKLAFLLTLREGHIPSTCAPSVPKGVPMLFS